MKPEDIDLGYLVTGIVERAPEGAWVLRVTQDDGTHGYFPLEQVLQKYEGQEVRFTIATTDTIAKITALVGDVQVAEGTSKTDAS